MPEIITDACVVTCLLLGIAFGLLLTVVVALEAYNATFKLFWNIKLFVEFLNWKHQQEKLAKQKGGRNGS